MSAADAVAAVEGLAQRAIAAEELLEKVAGCEVTASVGGFVTVRVPSDVMSQVRQAADST